MLLNLPEPLHLYDMLKHCLFLHYQHEAQIAEVALKLAYCLLVLLVQQVSRELDVLHSLR